MAYFSQEQKAAMMPKIKTVLKKYGMKGTVRVNNHSTVILNLKSGPIEFDGQYINPYHYQTHYGSNVHRRALAFLTEMFAVLNEGNHNRSNPQIDYFDVGWYADIDLYNYNKG